MEVKNTNFKPNQSKFVILWADSVLKQLVFIKPLKTKLKHALLLLYHALDHWQLMQAMTSPVSRKLLEYHPKIKYKYLRNNYLFRTLSIRDALAIQTYHYQTLNTAVKENFLLSIINDSPILWQYDSSEYHFCIKISFPRNQAFPYDLADHEGDISLIFEVDKMQLGVISLTMVSGEIVKRVWHINDCKRAMFIARVQGVRDQLELFNAVTKVLYYNSPLRLLMSAVQGIAKALATDTLIGVSTSEQLSRGSKFNNTDSFFDYDSFWMQLGAKKFNDQVFFMPADIPEKPFEEVRPNQRSRTLKKRKLRATVINEICASFSNKFLFISEPRNE